MGPGAAAVKKARERMRLLSSYSLVVLSNYGRLFGIIPLQGVLAAPPCPSRRSSSGVSSAMWTPLRPC